MNTGRASTIAAAVIGLLLLGALGTYEVWQGLTSDVIGLRDGGVARLQQPILFWATFAVAVLIAAPMWIAVFFVVLLFVLHLLSTKAR